MKKLIRSTVPVLLFIGILVSNLMVAHASEITPRYTGISGLTAGMTISAVGRASCSGTVIVRTGYTADLTVELKQDGNTIKTWTDSGTGSLAAEGAYYVVSGHEYMVTTTVTIYDDSGNVVGNPSKDSPVKNY